MSGRPILKDYCITQESGQYGIPASAEPYESSKVRYLRITDISEAGELLNDDKKSVSASDIKKYLLKDGEIVFARTGNSTGKSYYHEAKNGILAYAGFLIKYSIDPKKINPKYLKFYTLSNEYKTWVNNLSLGSTRGNINAQTFFDCPLSVPARPQQDLLVKTLSLITDKIELNNRINSELETMAKTLYDYWFVQFDFPDKNGKPYKSSGGKMTYNPELKREIPDGWEVRRLGNIENNIITGKTPSTKNEEYFNGDIPFITIGDIRGNMHIVNTQTKLSKSGAETQKNKYLPKGSLCVTCIASPGLIGFASERSQTNQQINSIVIQKAENKSYLYFALNDYFNFSKGAKTGNTFANMNKGDFEDIRLVYSPSRYLFEFEKTVKPNVEKILVSSIENQHLSTLRDWLLPMLMNGQVVVRSELVE